VQHVQAPAVKTLQFVGVRVLAGWAEERKHVENQRNLMNSIYYGHGEWTTIPSRIDYKRRASMSAPDQGPLSHEEIQELDQFLLESEGIEESMDISTLDGFLTAIVCGPKTIMPSEWIRWVWDMESGKDAPEFKD